MPDPLSRQRVQRLRLARKEQGFRETNVWLTKEVDQKIDDAVARGRFPSRRVAITHALATFFEQEKSTVT
ncbi:hypothetical protein [Microvirga arabica]|uniref:hypothetical protein n=1 Tax=Microvirga arabica TaxID=1128671 RepID=UPI001939BF59|nr:hypothetical protein [Microvirga arabica]MBM1175324.1 hypothetical protein [Microvirga arabica]